MQSAGGSFGPLVVPSIRPSVRPSVHLRSSVRPPAHPSIPPSIRPSDRLPIRPPVKPCRRFGHPSIRLARRPPVLPTISPHVWSIRPPVLPTVPCRTSHGHDAFSGGELCLAHLCCNPLRLQKNQTRPKKTTQSCVVVNRHGARTCIHVVKLLTNQGNP